MCLYDVAERVMLRRFQISNNKSLDGVLDMLNSRWVIGLKGLGIQMHAALVACCEARGRHKPPVQVY